MAKRKKTQKMRAKRSKTWQEKALDLCAKNLREVSRKRGKNLKTYKGLDDTGL